MVHDGISFDKSNIVRNLTLFLYPDDSDEAGRKLRIYQQYFMVSNGAQMILEDIKSKGISLTDLDKHVCIQINDTHPSMVIPELIRLLMKEGLTMKQAIDITSKHVLIQTILFLQKHLKMAIVLSRRNRASISTYY